MTRYRASLADAPSFVVPVFYDDLTTPHVLAMSFFEGVPIGALERAEQDVRDRAMHGLIALVLRELLDWGLMQTDPNFANYRWQADVERIVLLDFGAAREVPADTVERYRTLLAAGLSDRDAVRSAVIAAGFLG